MGASLEASPQHQEGARINLNVDLAPGDCYMMCKQLFVRLKDHEKKEILDDYLRENGVSFNMCEENTED